MRMRLPRRYADREAGYLGKVNWTGSNIGPERKSVHTLVARTKIFFALRRYSHSIVLGGFEEMS
jgi:hypothetical protein